MCTRRRTTCFWRNGSRGTRRRLRRPCTLILRMRNSSTESVLSAAGLPRLTSVRDQVASPLFSVGGVLRIARRGSLPLGIFLLVWTSPAFGHRDDYLNETFVFQTIEKGEFEPELWIDAGRGRERSGGFRAYAAAFEYGITGHWMVDQLWGMDRPDRGIGVLAADPCGDSCAVRRG